MKISACVSTQGAPWCAYSNQSKNHLTSEKDGGRNIHIAQISVNKNVESKIKDLPTSSLQKETSTQDFFYTKAKEIEDRLSQGEKSQGQVGN